MDHQIAATRFVEGRHSAVGFEDFPGHIPEDLATAYAIQRAAAHLWGEAICGWKVGRIIGEDETRLGENRFVGPIPQGSIFHAGQEPWRFPVIEGGFAAVEAELIAVIDDATAPPEHVFTPENCASTISGWHIGIECAGSPFSRINEMGPLASIAGFGNNMGLYVGPQVELASPDDVLCTVTIDGKKSDRMRAGQLPGGPLAAIAFTLNKLKALDYPIPAGLLISTGAITGVHPVSVEQSCTAEFEPGGKISFTTARAEAA